MTPRPEKPVKILIADYRCRECGRLLFRAHIPNLPGIHIEARCSRCGMLFVLQIKAPAKTDPLQNRKRDILAPEPNT